MSTEQRPVRVLIVEDSATVRSLLSNIICTDPRLTLAGVAASAESALRQLETLSPDIITMDIELPGMNGIEATKRIMSTRPTPIIILSAYTRGEMVNQAVSALEAGALTILDKPTSENAEGFEQVGSRLVDQLLSMSSLKLVRQRFNTPPLRHQNKPLSQCNPSASSIAALGLVASTGGPGALAGILGALPERFPVPVLLIQHIGDSFVEGFVRWLQQNCRLHVKIADVGDIPTPGFVYVAPGGTHMAVRGGRIWLEQTSLVDGHRPSGTVLLQSMADYWGPQAIGAVLTGMGEDGARGLAAMKAAGAITIAQDQATSIVYGMPAAAAALGAASHTLPLQEIPAALCKMVGADLELASIA